MVDWTDDEVALIREHAGNRKSAAQIESILRSAGYIRSRCAVLGKALRENIPIASDGGKNRKLSEKRRAQKLEETRQMVLQREAAPGVELLQLEENQCRWALNDGETYVEHRFCGRETERGASFCDFHRALGTKPAEPRRPRADTRTVA